MEEDLTKLYLFDRKIEIISKEIKYLTKLEELYLFFNTIKIIPKEIKFLINLKEKKTLQ